jgi:hypothetical protein
MSLSEIHFFLFNSFYVLTPDFKLGNSWQVISPVEVVGYIEVVDELLTVQNKSYEKPTILVAKSVKGEEEIPDGTVAVLTPDMPDVLSHVSVRARNSKVFFPSLILLYSIVSILLFPVMFNFFSFYPEGLFCYLL